MILTDVSIVIPVKEDPAILNKFLDHHNNLFASHLLFIVDSGGGEVIPKRFPHAIYMKKDIPFWEARLWGIKQVQTPYTLNLDADNLLPPFYLEKALQLFQENSKLGAVAIDYEQPHFLGHIGFGTSLFKTSLLKSSYTWTPWTPKSGELCECIFMWRQLHSLGCSLETLPLRAKHLK